MLGFLCVELIEIGCDSIHRLHKEQEPRFTSELLSNGFSSSTQTTQTLTTPITCFLTRRIVICQKKMRQIYYKFHITSQKSVLCEMILYYTSKKNDICY